MFNKKGIKSKKIDLINEKIEDMTFSLDDVLNLNQVVGGCFIVGEIYEIKIAVIGIKNNDGFISRINFYIGRKKCTKDFNYIMGQDALNGEYYIYLFDYNDKIKLNTVLEIVKKDQFNKKLILKQYD